MVECRLKNLVYKHYTYIQIPIYNHRSDAMDNFQGSLSMAGTYQIPEVSLLDEVFINVLNYSSEDVLFTVVIIYMLVFIVRCTVFWSCLIIHYYIYSLLSFDL
jgi:hypothetical protein